MKKNNLNVDPSSYNVLNHPLDSALILRKKNIIKRELLLNEQLIPKKIALLGGSTTAEIKEILELFLLNLGIRPEFYESAFNKYYEEAVFDNKTLDDFKPDIIYLHITHKNIITYPQLKDSSEKITLLFQQEGERYERIWSSLGKYQCPIIQNNFDYPQYRILGNLDSSDPHGQVHYINRLNSFLANEAQKQSNLHIHDINYLAASLGLNRWFDKQLWYSARYALSYEAITHLSKSLAALIGSLFGISRKCLVLDLDNTCWGGEIGDDGVEGIVIGSDSALAEVYSEFQYYLKLLKDRGIVLAACSKNNIEQAKAGFKHPDTVLTENDFSAFEANWEPKHKNLTKVAELLNLHLDSIVFIDDNPAERQLINNTCPEVSVPDVGSDAINFIEHIDKNYYFETAGLSIEDTNRNDFYKRKLTQTQHAAHYLDYSDYLNSLGMKAEIQFFSSLYLPRITQLINKTHQFNATNKTYTLGEIETISTSLSHLNLYGRLSDTYGDYGLISVIISKIQNKECHIDSWLMSCRVFKRTMEHAMLDTLVKQCRSLGITTIIGYYYPTPKNRVIVDLYKNFGFSLVEDAPSYSSWKLELNDYTPQSHHIRINP